MLTKVENIPEELKKVPNWVCVGKTDKIPKNPFNGKNAKSNDPKTWGTFEQAVKACESFGFDFIGFEFSPPYFGIDLDHCMDKVDFIDEFAETLQSYTEISRSGDGIHIICRGKLPEGSRRKGGVEMYSEGRYFIVTGRLYNEKYKTINECTETVKVLHSKYLPAMTPKAEIRKKRVVELDDSEIIDKARACKTGTLFTMLYDGQWEGLTFTSQSEADLALCNQLAFWTGRNEAQMDRLFRASGLYRDKWNQLRGSDTYGNATIKKACANCVNVYEPQTDNGDTSVAMGFFGKQKKKQYDMTDTGNAHRLHDKYGSILKYSYNRKKWFFWTGKRWTLDEGGEIKKLADDVCEDIKQEAWQIPDDEEALQKTALKWANRTANSSAKEAMIKECQHLENIPAAPDDFDSYLDFLNVQNGVVNLRNGELMPHDSSLMLSKITNCEYDVKRGKPKLWLKFLNDVTNGDKKLQDYIQKCVGYSISGSNKEQCAYFLYGMGNNGKSTFLDTLADMLGDYASNTQPDTLTMQSKLGSLGGGANTEIARLKSARFVTCEEPTEGVRLNEGLLKQLTGGSKVTARFLYSEEFEFTPEFKIWVATNHKPVIRGTDVGIWRRIKLIPFEVNIPKDKVDKNLKYKLRQEFPQILAWAVEGCIKWQAEGELGEPTRVIEATKDYKQEMDTIAGFVEQCIMIDYDDETKVMGTDLFALYKLWAKTNNEFEMTAKKFGMEISNKLPEKGRNSKGVFYKHIAFTEYSKELMPTLISYGNKRVYRAEDFK